MMEIRNIKIDDINRFVKLYIESYKGLEEYAYTNEGDIKRYFNWLLSRDPYGFFIIEDINKPIGVVACDTNWFSQFDSILVGEIHEIFVYPSYRRRGIGRMLVDKAIEYAKDRGKEKVGLWVGVKNLSAKEFYKKLGFIETITLGKWIRMIKKII
ncbi:MAG: GNAT family N-acetyltransferase [Nitrososphaerales archaeon]